MSTGKAVVRNAAANLALPAAAILTGPLLARSLGVEGRGALAAVLAVLATAMFLAPFGMLESLVYGVSRRRVPVHHARVVSVEVSLVFGVLAAQVVVLSAPVLLRDEPQAVDLLQVLALLLPLSVAGACMRGMSMGQQAFTLVAGERWLLALGRLLLVGALFVVGLLTLTSAAVVSVGVPILAALVLLPSLRRRWRRQGPPVPAQSLAQSRSTLFSYSRRSGPGSVLAILTARSDQVLLAPLAGVGELGLYIVAVSLAEIPATALVAVRDTVFAASSSRDDPALVAGTARIVNLLALPGVLVGIALTPVVLPVLFGEAFAGAVPVGQLLLLAFAAGTTSQLLSSGLLGLGLPGLRSYLQAGEAVLTISLLALGIALDGASGAALALLVARLVSAVAFVTVFSRRAGLRARDCILPGPDDARALVRVVRRRRR